ncbi:hypothetical protein BH10PLA1_BH10PLA1_06220 [soil metagenome]
MATQLPIEHYTAERIPNPYPAGVLPWQVYHYVRNAVVRCCRKFGRTGPMGECPIVDGELPDREWKLGDPDPLDFFVIDDHYNDERFIYLSIVNRDALTGQWVRELMLVLADFVGWGIGIVDIPTAYILIFADKLMVTGEVFGACHDIECVIREGQRVLGATA